VVPAATGLTTPEEEIVATLVLVLLQKPPVAAVRNVSLVTLAQITLVPVIVSGLGSGLTVTTAIAKAVPHTLVTV
jgi:hypothetical protein